MMTIYSYNSSKKIKENVQKLQSSGIKILIMVKEENIEQKITW